MRVKRSSQRTDELTERKKRKNIKTINTNDYFKIILEESGLQLKDPPHKCISTHEPIIIVRNLKKNLLKPSEYQNNLSEFYSNFENRCDDLDVFKHYLFPNITRVTVESSEHYVADSVLKILLSLPTLQNKFVDYIFEKAIELAVDSKFSEWIQMILKCFTTLDNIVDCDKISTHLINLLHVTSDKMLRLEIITAIPDIIGDQAQENISIELSTIMSDHELIPAILDCLSYLYLSDDQYEQLQKITLNKLMTLSKCSYFPNFVKFLLMAGRISNSAYLEAVQGLRNALCWSTSIDKVEDIASSQILTATAVRNSILLSKVISNAWLKVVTNCKVSTDHKPLDIIIIIILYSTSEEKQKQLESTVRKQIKLNILNEELMDESFQKFIPILKEYLKHLISLTNSLLKTTAEPIVQNFASYIYELMFSNLKDCCQIIVSELLQLGLDSKQYIVNILSILNKVAFKDITTLKPQSVQMLTLLDRMDDMNLCEIRAVMNLVCGLAYSFENSVIRDDIYMIIRKELGSSNPAIKVQGILAGIHAVKFLMACKDGEDVSVALEDENSCKSVNHLPEGDLREAAQIIEVINCSTKQFPDMTALFYDELYKVIESAKYINIHFLHWITDAVTNDLQQNFIVDSWKCQVIDNINLDMQYCLNKDSEIDEVIAVNIGGLTLEATEDVNILFLCPLFQLVQTLHAKTHNGDLSSIDALLGCPVIMPILNIDVIEEQSNSIISHILDCHIHCVNWFREMLNAFASQNDHALKSKIFWRISHICKLETLISQILIKKNFSYKQPVCMYTLKDDHYDNLSLENKRAKKQNLNQKMPKKATQEDSLLSDTLKSQTNQKNILKNKVDPFQVIAFRPLSLNILNLLNNELIIDNEEEAGLSIENLVFLLKCINSILETILISRIKKKTFLTKHEIKDSYDQIKAEKCAHSVYEILPKIMNHIRLIISYLDKSLDSVEKEEHDFLFNKEILNYISGLENILHLFAIYFKWMGFKNHHHKTLLKTSLCYIASSDSESSTFLKDSLLAVAKYFQKYEKYCIQLTTAVSLIEIFNVIQDYSSNLTITKISRDVAHNFLCQQWRTPDGNTEKGLVFNQNIDIIAKVYFVNNDILGLKNTALLLVNDAATLNNRNSVLNSFKSINKSNFTILYRNLGNAALIISKTNLNKGLTNLEHLNLWKDIIFILKCMSEIAKSLADRNNLYTFFKKALPIIRLFLTQGIPILELEFKRRTQEIIEILKTFQQSTRFLQSLCCHSRLERDTALLNRVPYMRQLLETLIYKVKAMLAANDCSEAFWMGNLKNKNILGEVIATQESTQDESAEDCDEQLPDDDDSDDTDNEIHSSDSNTVSSLV